MGFIITDKVAKEISEYCKYQEYEEYKETCRYCVFNDGDRCRLYDEEIGGFPSEWSI